MSKTDKLRLCAAKLHAKSEDVDCKSKETLVEVLDTALEVVKETMDLLDELDTTKN